MPAEEGLKATLSFHAFSWRGDKKWANASRWMVYAPRWMVYAPIVQVFNFVFSIVEITCGSV